MSDRKGGRTPSTVKRRRLLEMLSLAGIGSIAGCGGRTGWVEDQLPGWARDRLDSGGSESASTATQTPSSASAPEPVETSFTATHRTTSERLAEVADAGMDVSFTHEPVEMSFEDSPLIESIGAWSAEEVVGDVVRAVPREATSRDVAVVFESLWGVTGDASVTSAVNGTSYEFTGGETDASFAALVGTSEGESGAVFAVRAPDTETASDVARQLTGSELGE
jgi:hypothetical protein